MEEVEIMMKVIIVGDGRVLYINFNTIYRLGRPV
jgi:hypothetical protein